MPNNLSFYDSYDSEEISPANLHGLLEHARDAKYVITDTSADRSEWLELDPKIIFLDAHDVAQWPSAEVPISRANVFIDSSVRRNISPLLVKFRESTDIDIFAPKTMHFFSHRPVFINSVPKCGTHLLSNCLAMMGLSPPPTDALPKMTDPLDPGTYYNLQHMLVDDLSGQYHNIHEFIDNLSKSVIIFISRDPRDAILSLANYIPRQAEYHILGRYLNSLPQDEIINSIIRGDYLIPLLINENYRLNDNIRSLFENYRKWHPRWWPNLWPVRYEELVGPKGFGTAEAQMRTVWGLQLALHVPGSPLRFADKVFSENSVTFFRGTVGQYQSGFSPSNYRALESVSTDFIREAGYANRWMINQSFQINIYNEDASNLQEIVLAIYCELSTKAYGNFQVSVDPPMRSGRVKRKHTKILVEARNDTGSSISINEGNVASSVINISISREVDGAWISRVSGKHRTPDPEPREWTALSAGEVARWIIYACVTEELCRSSESGGEDYLRTGDGNERYGWFRGEIASGFDDDAARAGLREAPYLFEADLNGSNIVHYRHRYFAVPIALGAVDLTALTEAQLSVLPHEADLTKLRRSLRHPAATTEGTSGQQPELSMPDEALWRRTAALEETLGERDVRLRGLETTLSELQQRVHSLEHTLDERHHRLQSLEKVAEHRDRSIDSLGRALTTAEDRLRHVEEALQGGARIAEELQHAIQRLLVLERETALRQQRVEGLEQTLDERSQRLARVEQTLEREAALREQREARLEQTLDERTQRLTRVEQTLEREAALREQRAARLEQTLDERTQRLARVEKAIEERRAGLVALEAAFGEQLTDLRMGVKKGLHATAILEESIQAVDEQITDLRVILLEAAPHSPLILEN